MCPARPIRYAARQAIRPRKACRATQAHRYLRIPIGVRPARPARLSCRFQTAETNSSHRAESAHECAEHYLAAARHPSRGFCRRSCAERTQSVPAAHMSIPKCKSALTVRAVVDSRSYRIQRQAHAAFEIKAPTSAFKRTLMRQSVSHIRDTIYCLHTGRSCSAQAISQTQRENITCSATSWIIS